jgi:uncharacterized Zn-binding protein involved in type VI secretion
MAQPLVMGDKIQGQCSIHLIPNPASGAPQPGPPMPFSAPLLMSLEPTVTIGGKPVAVVGSQGLNTPPHVGLHPTGDPFFVSSTQIGAVVSGSPTVTAGGKPIATTSSQVTMCAQMPGQPISTVADVTVA